MALRLIVISFIVGVILETFGLNPVSLFSEVVPAAKHLVELGFTDVHQLGRISCPARWWWCRYGWR